MIHFELVLVTPEMATEMLRNNAHNRTVSNGNVKKISEDIRNDNFVETHQGIGIGPDGEIVDGQHRLMGIIQAGKPVWMYIARYSTLESANKARLVIDRGKKRDIGASIEIAQIVQNAGKKRVAVANIIYAIENGTSGKCIASDSEVVAIVVKTMGRFDAIRDVVSATWNAPAMGAFVWALAFDSRVVELAKRLENAANLPDNEALTGSEIALRDVIKSSVGYGGSAERMAYTLKVLRAIEFWLDGRKLLRIMPVDRIDLLARFRARAGLFNQAAE